VFDIRGETAPRNIPRGTTAKRHTVNTIKIKFSEAQTALLDSAHGAEFYNRGGERLTVEFTQEALLELQETVEGITEAELAEEAEMTMDTHQEVSDNMIKFATRAKMNSLKAIKNKVNNGLNSFPEEVAEEVAEEIQTPQTTKEASTMNKRTINSVAKRFNDLQTLTLTKDDIAPSTLRGYLKKDLFNVTDDGLVLPTPELMRSLVEADVLTFAHGWVDESVTPEEAPEAPEAPEEVVEETPVVITPGEQAFNTLKEDGRFSHFKSWEDYQERGTKADQFILSSMLLDAPEVEPLVIETTEVLEAPVVSMKITGKVVKSKKVKAKKPKKAKEPKKPRVYKTTDDYTSCECGDKDCDEKASNQDEIEDLFGWRNIMKGPGGARVKVQVPQSNCRACRKRKNAKYAKKKKALKQAEATA